MGAKTKRFVWVILAGALFVWCFLRLQRISEDYKKMQEPVQITELGSAELRPGEIVSVVYDSIYSGYYYGGVPYGKILEYQVLKLYGREEYIYVSAYTEDDGFYKAKPYYFRSLKDSEAFKPSEKYTFLGRVYELAEDAKNDISMVITKERPEEPVPMTLQNTNLKVEVRLLDIEEEAGRKTNWTYVVIAAGLFWLFMIYRFAEQFRAEAFLKKKERMEREEARNIERKVRFTSQIEDDDIWKDN